LKGIYKGFINFKEIKENYFKTDSTIFKKKFDIFSIKNKGYPHYGNIF